MQELDVRGLLPPEPFENIIRALQTLPAGESLQVWPATRWREEQGLREESLRRNYDRIAHAILGVAAPAAPGPATEPAG